jgi:hypothetical protein
MKRMTQLPNPTGPKPAVSMVRTALNLLLLSLLSFAAAFALRRAFFWDIKPVSWDETPPQNGALEAAFLLLSIENVAGVVAAIAAVAVVVTWVRGHVRTHVRIHVRTYGARQAPPACGPQ